MEKKLTESAYDWIQLPEDLPRKNLLYVTAKTTLPTFHPTDPNYPIRKFKLIELKERGASLSRRPIGYNHGLPHRTFEKHDHIFISDKCSLCGEIKDAFTVDASFNASTGNLEALLYLPDTYMNIAKKYLSEGKEDIFSVEYYWRDEKRTSDGAVEFEGLTFDRIDLLDGKIAGDSGVTARLCESTEDNKRGIILMEATEVKEKSEDEKLKESVDKFFESIDPKKLSECVEYFKKKVESIKPIEEKKEECVPEKTNELNTGPMEQPLNNSAVNNTLPQNNVSFSGQIGNKESVGNDYIFTATDNTSGSSTIDITIMGVPEKLSESTEEKKEDKKEVPKDEPKKEEPKKEEPKEVKKEEPKQENKPIEEKKETPPTTKEPEKQIEAKPDANVVRIKELEEAVSKLTESVKKADTIKMEAVERAKKESKKEILNKFKEVIPPSDVVFNFNYGGRKIVDNIRKIVLTESGE